MNELLPAWVYRNLERYGNCSIGNRIYTELGHDAILEDLKKHGFICQIRIASKKEPTEHFLHCREEQYTIIEVL